MNTNKKIFLSLGLVTLIALLGIGSFVNIRDLIKQNIVDVISVPFKNHFVKEQKIDPATDISMTLDTCINSSKKDVCLRDTTTNLLQKYSLTQILTILEKENPSFLARQNCHLIVHYFGQNEYKRTRNLPSSLQACTTYCGNGCYHGLAEGYYLTQKMQSNASEKDIVASIQSLCKEKNLKDPRVKKYCENGSLPHGIGHVLMYFTNNDIRKSLSHCDGLNQFREKESCYEGVFMAFDENAPEVFKNQGGNSAFQNKIAKDPLYPCNQYEEKYTKGCYQALATRHADTMSERIKRCDAFPMIYQEFCYRRIAQTSQILNPTWYKRSCDEVEDLQNRKWCVEGVVVFLLTWGSGKDFAIQFCSIVDPQVKKGCYEKLYDTMMFFSHDPNEVCKNTHDQEYTYWCKK